MKKKKVGIYGGSYAYEYQQHIDDTDDIIKNRRLDIGVGWPTLLRETYDVSNYSIPGCSTYFSYKKFIENHKRMDFNIFLPTPPTRLSVEDDDDVYHINPGFSTDQLRNLAKQSRENKTGKYLPLMDLADAVDGYYKCILDVAENELYVKLLTDYIKTFDPNCLVVKTSSNGPNELNQVSNMESKALKYDYFNVFKHGDLDLRYCHLTKENNEIVAQKITNHIEGVASFAVDANDFVKPPTSDRKKYIINGYLKENNKLMFSSYHKK